MKKTISLKKAKPGDELHHEDGTVYLVIHSRTRYIKSYPMSLEDCKGITAIKIINKQFQGKSKLVGFLNKKYKLIKINDDSNEELLKKAKKYREEELREAIREFREEVSLIIKQSIDI